MNLFALACLASLALADSGPPYGGFDTYYTVDTAGSGGSGVPTYGDTDTDADADTDSDADADGDTGGGATDSGGDKGGGCSAAPIRAGAGLLLAMLGALALRRSRPDPAEDAS